MPHVVVKLWPGKTEAQKQQLADAITKDLIDILGSSEPAVSVGIEEIDSGDWAEKVYRPEIKGKADTLYKEPGYTM